MKEITKAQEEILNALWRIKEGAISDVVDVLPDPKPAYNTVATVIKVLEKKGYLTHKTYGKTNVYFPVIKQKVYAQSKLKDTVKSFFNGSFNQMASSFINSKNLTVNELEELKKIIDEQIKKENK